MSLPLRRGVGDDHVDRRQVEAERSVELSRTNEPGSVYDHCCLTDECVCIKVSRGWVFIPVEKKTERV